MVLMVLHYVCVFPCAMVPLYLPVLQVHFVAIGLGFYLGLDVEPRMVRAGGYECVCLVFQVARVRAVRCSVGVFPVLVNTVGTL